MPTDRRSVGGAALLALTMAVALLVAACGSSAEEVDTGSTPEPTPSAQRPESTPPPTSSPTSTAEPTAPVPTQDDRTTDEGAGDGDATDGPAGTPIDFFFREGDVLGVIGVAHDDVLNVRAGPGVDAEVVATMPPLRDDVRATGAARQLPASIWAEIDTGSTVGWVNTRYLAYLGRVDDVTHEVVDTLDDDRPRADTMLELGRAVAATRASTDPPSDIVVVARPTAGDLGEVVIDVIGVGDDALRGLRLHVFGQPIRTDGGFGLKSVEQTLLCGRGVSNDGLCT